MRNIGFRAISINVPDMEGQWVTTDEIGFVNFFYALKEGDLDEKTLGEKTGLKDKNGKEIYEGDIVKGTFLLKYEVFFDKGEWRIGEDGLFKYLSGAEIEVIGNIYENPELLKI